MAPLCVCKCPAGNNVDTDVIKKMGELFSAITTFKNGLKSFQIVCKLQTANCKLQTFNHRALCLSAPGIYDGGKMYPE